MVLPEAFDGRPLSDALLHQVHPLLGVLKLLLHGLHVGVVHLLDLSSLRILGGVLLPSKRQRFLCERDAMIGRRRRRGGGRRGGARKTTEAAFLKVVNGAALVSDVDCLSVIQMPESFKKRK